MDRSKWLVLLFVGFIVLTGAALVGAMGLILFGLPSDPGEKPSIEARPRQARTRPVAAYAPRPREPAWGFEPAAPPRPGPGVLCWWAMTSPSPVRAVELLDRAHEQDAGFVPALLLRAGACRVLRQPARSRLDLEATLALAPECIPALRMRAELRAEAGNVEGAIADCDRILGIDSREGSTLSMRGGLFRKRGDLAGAETDLAAASSLMPADAGLRLALARVRRERGEFESAARDAEAVLALDPGNAEALLERGLVRRARGDPAGARRDLGEAGSRAEQESDDLFRRAMSRIDERRFGEARQDLERAGSLDRVADEAFAAALSIAPWRPPGSGGPR